VLQKLNYRPKRGLKQASGSAVWWQYSNSARYNKKRCRRSNTAGRSTALVIYVFEISYYYFHINSCTTLKQKLMIPD